MIFLASNSTSEILEISVLDKYKNILGIYVLDEGKKKLAIFVKRAFFSRNSQKFLILKNKFYKMIQKCLF